MTHLSKNYLKEIQAGPMLQLPDEPQLNLPEKVLQFGTGVLLRGLPDYFIEKANRQGIFNGRIVVVKSTDSGDSGAFDRQDNLYTLSVRGIEDSQAIEENIVCASISRVLSAKSQWQDILACASNPDMQVVISNTTEVGIQLVQDDIHQQPPVSFPGKLLAFLYERFKAFKGDPEKGMVIVPTELISDNGKKLESIVFELAHRNGLELAFIDWLEESNHFCNSLVDRIVPGKPEQAIKQAIEAKLGYQDDLLTVAEVYTLWAIEGDDHVKAVLSFHQADEGVIVDTNIDLQRELKLRLLNGTHTLSCGLAFLLDLPTVKDAMQNPLASAFISNLMQSELAPAIPYQVDEKVAQRFSLRTLDRFRNPHIEHYWINITLHYTSKMKMRNVPTLLNYYQVFNCVPEYMAMGFAAYLLFMKAVKKNADKYLGEHNGQVYPIQDDKAAYFYDKWQSLSVDELVHAVLQDKSLWEEDLTLLPGFEAAVARKLKSMVDKGVLFTIECFMNRNDCAKDTKEVSSANAVN